MNPKFLLGIWDFFMSFPQLFFANERIVFNIFYNFRCFLLQKDCPAKIID
jgi:hypothetical protein